MKTRRTSPMKGKKYSPEHLEERRRQKAAREERWRLFKEGKEAQRIYSAFMHQPAWMTHISKKALIECLTEIINEEKDTAAAWEKESNMLNAEYDKLKGKGMETMEELLRGSKMTTKSMKLYIGASSKRDRLSELEFLLSLFVPKDDVLKMWYGEAQQVHPDFAVYARDN